MDAIVHDKRPAGTGGKGEGRVNGYLGGRKDTKELSIMVSAATLFSYRLKICYTFIRNTGTGQTGWSDIRHAQAPSSTASVDLEYCQRSSCAR